MRDDTRELEQRLEVVAVDAARAPTLTGSDWVGLLLFTIALPAVLLVVGWFL